MSLKSVGHWWWACQNESDYKTGLKWEDATGWSLTAWSLLHAKQLLWGQQAWLCGIVRFCYFFSLCLIQILIYQQVSALEALSFPFPNVQYTYPGTDLSGEKNRIFRVPPFPGSNSLLTRTNKLLEDGFLLLTCKLMLGTCYLTHTLTHSEATPLTQLLVCQVTALSTTMLFAFIIEKKQSHSRCFDCI